MTVYAINKRTKEHAVVTNDNRTRYELNTIQWEFVETDADGWIPWSGEHRHDNPLPNGHPYEIKDDHSDPMRLDAPETMNWLVPTHYRPILSDDGGEQPEWNGEGLPPVGCECQYVDATGNWHDVEITAIGSKGVLFVESGKYNEKYTPSDPRKFRPAISAEDRAVEEVAEIIAEHSTLKSDCHYAQAAGRALYRAGYRKEK